MAALKFGAVARVLEGVVDDPSEPSCVLLAGCELVAPPAERVLPIVFIAAAVPAGPVGRLPPVVVGGIGPVSKTSWTRRLRPVGSWAAAASAAAAAAVAGSVSPVPVGGKSG